MDAFPTWSSFVGSYYFWGSLGFLAGFVAMLRNTTRDGLPPQRVVVAWTLAIYGGLLGARMLCVLEGDPGLFMKSPLMAVAFWQGGLSWQGGLVGGAIAAVVALRALGLPVWRTLGSCAPGLALAGIIARNGCIAAGCCYGAPTTLPWAVFCPALNAHVHPMPVYTMIGEAINGLVLQYLWRKPANRPYLMPLYAIILCSTRLFLDALRGTPPGPEIIPGLRFYQSISVFVILLAIPLLLYIRKAYRVAVVQEDAPLTTKAG